MRTERLPDRNLTRVESPFAAPPYPFFCLAFFLSGIRVIGVIRGFSPCLGACDVLPTNHYPLTPTPYFSVIFPHGSARTKLDLARLIETKEKNLNI